MVIFASGIFAIFYNEKSAYPQSRPSGCQPLFLCVGRAEVCDSDACFDRAELFLWIVDWEDAE